MRPSRPSRKDIIDALHRLGLHLPASTGDVVRAHRELAKISHPDRFRLAARKRLATEVMKELNHARAFLLDHLDDFLQADPWQWTRRGCVRCCAAYTDLWPLDPRD